jgi:hypothetical protein
MLKNKRLYFGRLLTILTGILFMFIGLIACGESRQFVLRNDLVNCSFKYPSAYSSPAVYNSSENSISISSGMFSGTRENSQVDSRIGFYIFKHNNTFINYNTLLEFTLNQEKRGPGEFFLIDRSEIYVAGIQGEKVTYNYSIYNVLNSCA